MIKFINKDFGTEMWVAENRKEEYIAAGHKPAAKAKAVKPNDGKTKSKELEKMTSDKEA